MNKKAFNALKTGDKVLVNGRMDSGIFLGDTGTVADCSADDYAGEVRRKVRFDTWADGHGKGLHDWYFRDDQLNDFIIHVISDDEPKKPKPNEPKTPKPKKAPHGPQAYKGNGKHMWEYVVEQVWRLRVPGGWLYHNRSGAETMAFVPAPDAIGYVI